MGKKLHVPSLILSLAGAYAGACLLTPKWEKVNGAMEHILWSGAFFLIIFIFFKGFKASFLFHRHNRNTYNLPM